MLDPIVKAFEAEVRKVRLNEPTIPYISNVTGTWITRERGHQSRLLGHARQSHGQVQRCVARAVAVQESRFSWRPGPAGRWACWPCSTPTGGTPETRSPFPRSGTITKTSRTLNFCWHSVGRLWLSGAEIKWDDVYRGKQRRRVPLPTYPFERHHYWIETTSDSSNGSLHQVVRSTA